jgi:transposase-like protein
MGQVLHGSATTTEAIRRTIQHSQASLRALARRYGINPKTVAKWKKRGSVADLPTGPRRPKSTASRSACRRIRSQCHRSAENRA